MISGITGLTSSLLLSKFPFTWKSRQRHFFIWMKLVMTGVTKSQNFSREEVIVVANQVCIVTSQVMVDSFCKCSLMS